MWYLRHNVAQGFLNILNGAHDLLRVKVHFQGLAKHIMGTFNGSNAVVRFAW